jgi:fructokinase
MILSTGEALYDMIGTVIDGRQGFLAVHGGSTMNVALGLARMGRPAGYLTKLGTDFFGRGLHDFIAREGIDTRFVVRANMPTTMAFVALGSDGQPDYSFYANGAADRSLTPDELPDDLGDDVHAVHFGSISLVLEPTASTLTGLMRRESGRRVVSLDPNIRASLISDRPAYLARFEAMLALAHIVKGSVEDVAWMGGPAEAAATARAWSGDGRRIAVVTDGGTGATFAHRGETGFMPAFAVDVVDTVGAGDTFQATMLARLDEMGALTPGALSTLDFAVLTEVVRFAAAAAAVTCTRRGADLPRRAEVERFLAERT